MLGSGARPVAAVCGRLARRIGTAGVHAAVGGWARAFGRAPEPLDDRWWPGDIGVDAGNGGRLLRGAPRDRLLQLAHGPVAAAAAGLPTRAWGGRSARTGACYESTRAAAGPLSRLPLRRAGAGSLDGGVERADGSSVLDRTTA